MLIDELLRQCKPQLDADSCVKATPCVWHLAAASSKDIMHVNARSQRKGSDTMQILLGQLTMMVLKTKSSSYSPQYGRDDMSPTTAAPTPMTCIADMHVMGSFCIQTKMTGSQMHCTVQCKYLFYKNFVGKLRISCYAVLPAFKESVLCGGSAVSLTVIIPAITSTS